MDLISPPPIPAPGRGGWPTAEEQLARRARMGRPNAPGLRARSTMARPAMEGLNGRQPLTCCKAISTWSLDRYHALAQPSYQAEQHAVALATSNRDFCGGCRPPRPRWCSVRIPGMLVETVDLAQARSTSTPGCAKRAAMTSSSHSPAPSPQFRPWWGRWQTPWPRRCPALRRPHPIRLWGELIVAPETGALERGDWSCPCRDRLPEGGDSAACPRAQRTPWSESGLAQEATPATGALPQLLRTRPGGGLAPVATADGCRPCWPSWSNGPRPGWAKTDCVTTRKTGSRGGSRPPRC